MTDHLVPTGLEGEDGSDFRRLLPRSSITRCPACRRTHAWHREEAVLEGSTRKERREITG